MRWNPTATDSRENFAVIGKSTAKRDGPEKVTGRTRYLHDLELPRLAHAKILRARHPHARIVRIETARARRTEGVLAVLTGSDVDQHPFGFARDQLALKRDKTLCIRDEVAAVVAECPEQAEEALALIDVELSTATWGGPWRRRRPWSRTSTR